MIDKIKIKWFYIFSAIYVALTLIGVVTENFWIYTIPFVLILALMFVFSLDKLVFLVIFFTPLSVKIDEATKSIHVGASVPTEPILFGIMLIFLIKLLYRSSVSKNYLKHPVTIALLINLLWILITCFTSQSPIVSFKFLTSRLWFVTVFYFIGLELFDDFKNVKKFVWLYVIPFTLIIFYTIFNHINNGLTQKSANWVMKPFYNDHTVYGAMLAMFIPVLIAFVFNKKYTKNIRIYSFVFLLIFLVAIVLSYTRAAWVSLIIALFIYLIFLFKIRTSYIIVTLIVCVGLFFGVKDQLFYKLEKNKQDSSTDIKKHVESISNVKSDASNLERINRWNSAFRMFKQKPMFGWGPGTYQFYYAPFQKSSEKTIISTDFGDNGNAHSEYIGPLAESGVLGSLSFIIVVIASIVTGVRVYKKLVDKEQKAIVLALLLGFITYLIHGGMNNFLDTDKASVPFWTFIAVFVILDVKLKNQNTYKKELI